MPWYIAYSLVCCESYLPLSRAQPSLLLLGRKMLRRSWQPSESQLRLSLELVIQSGSAQSPSKVLQSLMHPDGEVKAVEDWEWRAGVKHTCLA